MLIALLEGFKKLNPEEKFNILDSVRDSYSGISDELILKVLETAHNPAFSLQDMKKSLEDLNLDLGWPWIKSKDIENYIIPFVKRCDILHLSLNDSKISYKNLRLLSETKIQYLNLNKTKLIDKSFKVFSKFKDLTSLKICSLESTLTIDNVNTLIKSCHNIKFLKIGMNKLSEEMFMALLESDSLEELEAAYAPFTDKICEKLSDNKILKILEITENSMNFSQIGQDFLRKNNSLKEIRIRWSWLFQLERGRINALKSIELNDKLELQRKKLSFLLGAHERFGLNSPILSFFKKPGGFICTKEIFSYLGPEKFKVKMLRN